MFYSVVMSKNKMELAPEVFLKLDKTHPYRLWKNVGNFSE